jgi:hypothetical protein
MLYPYPTLPIAIPRGERGLGDYQGGEVLEQGCSGSGTSIGPASARPASPVVPSGEDRDGGGGVVW